LMVVHKTAFFQLDQWHGGKLVNPAGWAKHQDCFRAGKFIY
jgi:hypothetical protein